jgi:hypothetical protein
MIISVRGTHGSGKSTVVRRVMDFFPLREEVMRPGRRRPMGYILSQHNSQKRVAVLGHYETPCGGCDSIPVVEDMYDFAREYARGGADILLEGILAQHYALKKFLTFSEFGMTVLVLNTPLEQCIADTLARRGETTDERKAKITETIKSEYRNVERGAERLRDNKIDVRLVNRDEALMQCLGLLGRPMLIGSAQ